MGNSQKYEISELLGSGGSGRVYKAWDHRLRRYVALKQFSHGYLENLSVDEAASMEAFHLAGLQHPNIVTVYDVGVNTEGPYIVTNLVNGKTLRDFVHEYGVFKTGALKQAVKQTLGGLIAAHYEGLLHRDLKPGNIMVSQLPCTNLHYTLVDFGLARHYSKNAANRSSGNSITGSVPYVAPEQIEGLDVTPRTDLYAMGCLFYYMITGQNAFRGASIKDVLEAHIEHRVTPIQDIRQDIPESTSNWVMKMISRDPAHRPESASQALTMFYESLKSAPAQRNRPIVFQRFANVFTSSAAVS